MPAELKNRPTKSHLNNHNEMQRSRRKISESSNENQHLLKTIGDIRRTVYLLDSSIKISQSLEVEQSFKLLNMKMTNLRLQRSLREAAKKNNTMLNLFRKNITNDEIPDYLTREVNRSWDQKYDALLTLNDRLRKQVHAKNIELKEKHSQIRLLEEKLLNANEKLIQKPSMNTKKSDENQHKS